MRIPYKSTNIFGISNTIRSVVIVISEYRPLPSLQGRIQHCEIVITAEPELRFCSMRYSHTPMSFESLAEPAAFLLTHREHVIDVL